MEPVVDEVVGPDPNLELGPDPDQDLGLCLTERFQSYKQLKTYLWNVITAEYLMKYFIFKTGVTWQDENWSALRSDRFYPGSIS